MNSDHQRIPDPEFLELVVRYQDRSLTPEKLRQLNEQLRDDPERQAEFARVCETSRMIHEASLPPVQRERHERSSRRLPSSRSLWLEHAGLVALLLICVGLGILLWQQKTNELPSSNSVARLEYVSDDAAFHEEHVMPRQAGSLLEKGWVQLERGIVRITFHSGASVELTGPARFGIDSPMRAWLEFGRASVHAPESARDFAVATESMEVVDLGTRFGVSVDPQSRESKVSVIEGLVDLHLGSRGAERMIRPLEAGYAARVDVSGKIVDISSASGNDAASDTDNTRLLAHWTFDELGAGGYVEDSTGNQLHGILRGENAPRFFPGVSGQTLEFKDNTSVDLKEHLSTLAQLDAFTFATWVRDPGEPLAVLFSLSGESERHRVLFYLSRRFVRFGWQDGLHYDSISGRVDSWKTGRWYHLAVTVERGVARLYRDGTLIASGSIGSRIGTPVCAASMVKNASHAYLGRLEDGRQGDEISHQWFEGQMDDAQLYSGSVSQEGIRFMFEHPGDTWNPR